LSHREAIAQVKVGCCALAIVLCFVVLSGCSGSQEGTGFQIWRPKGFGVGGQYNEARNEMRKPGGNIAQAIVHLEYVVRKDPFYLDSLAQLGRAYYYAGRYKHAFETLKRAVAVNDQDEIAWLVLGMTQMRLGDDQQGLESFKGGLTLFIKHSKDGYKDVQNIFWDSRGVVRRTVRRSVFLSRKGPEEKEKIIRIGEILLQRIDRELYQSDRDQELNEFEYEKG